MDTLDSAAKQLGGLRLPPELEALEVVGSGRRSIVFKANYRGETLAMKAYRPDAIAAYRKKHDVNIGVFEMSQNRALRKIPELLPYVAKPIAVMGHDGRCSLLFLQEYIEGITLKALAEQNKGLPDSVLEAGEKIILEAELNEIYDLDLAYDRILVRKNKGVWLPVLTDFNEIQKSEKTVNPFSALALKTGLRKKSHHDRKNLQQWRNYSEQCSKQAG